MRYARIKRLKMSKNNSQKDGDFSPKSGKGKRTRKIDWVLIGLISFVWFYWWYVHQAWYGYALRQQKRIDSLELSQNRLESKMFQLPDYYKKVEMFQYKVNNVEAEQERTRLDMLKLEELLRPIEKKVFPDKYSNESAVP